MYNRDPRDYLPDVRDGLTHRERIVLQCLHALQQARGGRNVPTEMLYGTVVEYVDMSVEEMQGILVRLIGAELRSSRPLLLEPSQTHRGCTMQTVMIRGIVLSYLLLSGLCAVAHAAEHTITRTVEHFTLGMPKDQAFAVLLAGIKHHHFTLNNQWC